MKQKTAEAMRPLVEAYTHHQGSKKTFCQEHGLATHTLDYWRRKLNEQPAQSSAFIALDVEPSWLTDTIEVHYLNGVRVVVGVETPTAILQRLIQLGD